MPAIDPHRLHRQIAELDSLAGAKQLAGAVGNDWVRVYSGQLTESILGDALRWATRTQRPVCAPLDAFNWATIAGETVRAYRTLAASEH